MGRSTKVLNIAVQIENNVSELGTEGRMVKMQLEEMVANVQEEATLIIKDYSNNMEKKPEEILISVRRTYEDEISDSVYLLRSLALGTASSHLEQQVAPRGYRMLHKIPRIPPAIIDNLVERFTMLDKVLKASIEELDEVEGIGEVRARSIKNGLMRMREQILLEYMV